MTYRFFLGGRDLEMVEIGELLRTHAPGLVEDKGLAWGAALSAYREWLLAALQRGETPVAVELADDLPPDLFDRKKLIIVDHHGARAGADQPTSLEQVFSLLGLPREAWTRRRALVAANDRAHVAGLRAYGATAAEIAEIRTADRAAQGVTAADEIEARRAISARRQDGDLTIVETTSDTSTAVADLILPECNGPGYKRLMVLMPGKVTVFADGDMIARLAETYPNGWWGGDLPNAGFWGQTIPADAHDTIGRLIALMQ
jgi:hypothetical protein